MLEIWEMTLPAATQDVSPVINVRLDRIRGSLADLESKNGAIVPSLINLGVGVASGVIVLLFERLDPNITRFVDKFS